MKSVVLFPILLAVVLGGMPSEGLSSELRTAAVCWSGWLKLACEIGMIQIYRSTFEVHSNTTFCDPNITHCAIPTEEADSSYHTKIRLTCSYQKQCSIRSSFVYLEDNRECLILLADVVRIKYCCVLIPSTQCQDPETTLSPWTPIPSETGIPISTTTRWPPWITSTTELPPSVTTASHPSIPSPGDNTALIAGIVGSLAGAALIAAAIVVVVLKKRKPAQKSTKKTTNTPSINLQPPGVKKVNNEAQRPPGVYYVKPVKDLDSHHYQTIDWPTPPYYNVYNQYESIDYDENSINESREYDENYEEIGPSYLGLYGGSTT